MEKSKIQSPKSKIKKVLGSLLYWRGFPLEWAALRLARRRFEHLYSNSGSEESIASSVREKSKTQNPKPEITDPLVSVVIATWNRGQLLAERTIPSVLNQTYQNFEIVVVGDHCEDDTEERLAAFNDPRIRFTNLPERGKYPQKPDRHWRVAGTTPANKGLQLARGLWISYLDDDDVYTPDHIEVLLRFAQAEQLEFAYAACDREILPGEWVTIRDTPQRRGFDVYKDRNAWGNGVAHSTWLYRSYLRFFKYDIFAWAHDSYGDQNLVMRMGRAGVRARFLNRVVASMPLRPGDVILSQSRFRTTEEIEAERAVIRARWDVIREV